MSFELLDTMSDNRILIKILEEFHALVILDEFSSNPGRISQEFCGNLILEEFGSHLKLATRILIEILEEFHKISVVI